MLEPIEKNEPVIESLGKRYLWPSEGKPHKTQQ